MRTRRKRRRRRLQRGGAAASTIKRILRRGSTKTDKIAEGLSMFLLGPSPSFGALGRLLAKQVFKGLKDNVKHYRKRKTHGHASCNQ